MSATNKSVMYNVEEPLKIVFVPVADKNVKSKIIYIFLPQNYKELLFELRNYKSIEKLYKYWKDDDDDNIEINSENAYKMFLKASKKKQIFINIVDTNEPYTNIETDKESLGSLIEISLSDFEIHERVYCDECKMYPIMGLRYKCIVCPDYDLCMTCKKKNVHYADHKMMPISSEHDYLFAVQKIKKLEKKSVEVLDICGKSPAEKKKLNPIQIILNNFNELIEQITNLLFNRRRNPYSLKFITILKSLEDSLQSTNESYNKYDEFVESYDQSVLLEVLTNLNLMLNKIFDKLHNLNIEKELNRNYDILNIFEIESDQKIQTKHCFEIFNNLNAIILKIIEKIESNDNSSKNQSVCDNDSKKIDINTEKEEAKHNQNEDGWLESLIEAFHGDMSTVNDFLKPLNESFD